MMIILTTKFCFRPAELLRNKIEEISGDRYPIITDVNRVEKNKIFFRFGNTGDTNYKEESINPQNFVVFCGNKWTNNIMSTYVNTINYFRKEQSPDSYPIVGRESLYLSGGRGLHIIENDDEYNSSNIRYWSQYLNFSSEYRVHLLGGEIKKIFKKVRQEGLEPELYPIRNMHRGYKFSLRSNIDAFPKIKDMVEKLKEGLPNYFNDRNFCAIDVGVFDGSPYIIELNSAPGLSEIDAEMYAGFLIGKI